VYGALEAAGPLGLLLDTSAAVNNDDGNGDYDSNNNNNNNEYILSTWETT
jgi:hypothetical protein